MQGLRIALLDMGDVLQHLLFIPQHLHRMLKQALADVAQPQFFAALDQWRLQFRFQPGYRLAHRRLTDMQGLRRPLEPTFFHHCTKRT